MIRLKHLILLVGILGSTLMACGNVSPAGSKIVLSPDAVRWEVKAYFTTTTGFFVINFFDVLITDEDDIPLNDIEFEARLDLSPNQTNIPLTLQLLDKNNSPVISPFKTKTDEKGGYRLAVNIPLGTEFKAILYISTGNAFKSAAIEETIK